MDEKKKKTRKILLFVIIGLVVLALIAGLVFFLTRKYTVTFDSQGGTAVVEQKVGKGKTVTRPSDPTREGYDFMGWFYNEKEYNFNTPVKQNFTLIARWNESKFVTFIVDGEEIAKEHILNGRVTFPQAPAKDGFAFVGWKDDNGNVVPEEHLFSDNITLTAVYRVYIPVTSIRFEKATYSMEKGDTLKPKLVISPSNWVETISFVTSNSAVASVSPEGEITANGAGTAVITVNTESGHSASVEVNVKVSPKSMKFKNPEIIIKKGDTLPLDLEVDPEDYSVEITYTTSDKKIVTINTNEKSFTGVGYGTATITATYGKLKATMTVTVANPATKLTVTSPMSVDVGETRAISYTVTGSDSSSPSTSVVSFVSNSTGVATVDETGKVTGVSGGTATISVSTDNGLVKAVTVYVNELSVSLNGDDSILCPGDFVKLNDTIKIYWDGNQDTNIDTTKIKLEGETTGLTWSAAEGKITNTGVTSAGTRSVYFTYNNGTKTFKSKTFKIKVEPELKVTDVSGEASYSSMHITVTEGDAGSEAQFTVTFNQPVEVSPTGVTVSGNGSSSSYSCTFIRGGSGSLTITTKGGQSITLTIN
ncbi:MAG: InlB B-repeat-containing protein [Erysipelotrichaceae bacterium]|nr:InlB B-repeat-containing protein [Erysipelotrichaceae bacterium]